MFLEVTTYAGAGKQIAHDRFIINTNAIVSILPVQQSDLERGKLITKTLPYCLVNTVLERDPIMLKGTVEEVVSMLGLDVSKANQPLAA
ncbi:MAG: hypothetical protein V4628_05225 [Pseudomonadota bacterium]